MTIWFILLVLGAYLLGSVPTSFIFARLFQGIDLRRCGTRQVGGGNLWRMTSWKLALPVGVFDCSKGLVMVLAAHSVGLTAAQQLVVGLAAVIGHNWSVFLRFYGGRGVGTVAGVVIILPVVNSISSWVTIVFITIIVIGVLIVRSSPVPVLAAVIALPLTSWWSREPALVILGFTATLLVVVTKRITAQRAMDKVSASGKRLFFYRLLFDRDILDRKTWMYRKPAESDVTK